MCSLDLHPNFDISGEAFKLKLEGRGSSEEVGVSERGRATNGCCCAVTGPAPALSYLRQVTCDDSHDLLCPCHPTAGRIMENSPCGIMLETVKR